MKKSDNYHLFITKVSDYHSEIVINKKRYRMISISPSLEKQGFEKIINDKVI